MKKIVCVDLDGVLADYRDGFKGIDHIGDPIDGAAAFTHALHEFARVVVFTTRCKVYPEGTPGPDGVPEVNRSSQEVLAGKVKAWLDRHGFAYDEVYVGQGKPFAAAYVDDRAVVCRPQSPWVLAEPDPEGERPNVRQVFQEALWAAKNLCEGC